MSVPRTAPAERFQQKFTVESDCWQWVASVKPNGYAQFYDGKSVVYAHRWSYEHHVGPIPPGMELDHLCRNTRCVRPDHLEPVTRTENNARSESVSATNARKTHCKYGHPFNEANTYVHPVIGRRSCRTCHRQDEARRYAEKFQALRAVKGSAS